MNPADKVSPSDGLPAPVAGAVAEVRPAIPAWQFRWFLAVHAVVASVISFFLVLQSANDEPYTLFRSSDALTQVGLGCVLIALWIYLSAATLYGVITARISSWWLLLLLWAVIVLFYLRICPQGFVEDIAKFVPKP
ncbi:MAG: hypothetical protein WCI73_19235 [Phycisphaerae bacterium]